VKFKETPFAMEEVLFDPQTSGGLLVAVSPEEANALRDELQGIGLPAEIVGEITEKEEFEIYVD
jgi:selenide,water dikinase